MRDLLTPDDPRDRAESAGRAAALRLPVAAHPIGHRAAVPDGGREAAYGPFRITHAVRPRERA